MGVGSVCPQVPFHGRDCAHDLQRSAAENERGKMMRKTKCARRHAGWLVTLFLSALLLSLWCQPGHAEHLGAEFAWMAGSKGRGNQSCCGELDCVETTVALLEHDGVESTVMIGETVLTLPSLWVHPAQGPSGMWCFIPQATTGEKPGAYIDAQGRTRAIPPQTPTRENTRCAFFVSIN